MEKVFLAHSSKQKKLVKRIASNLGSRECIVDFLSFESGKRIDEEIRKNIYKSILLVLFISDDALNSTWVQQEMAVAKEKLSLFDEFEVYPVIVDHSIDYLNDERIPNWLKQYIGKPILQDFLILHRIKNKMREIAVRTNPYLARRKSLFVGRNNELALLEDKLLLSEQLPKSIIISGHEGIGRRTLLSKALEQIIRIINKNYEPISISLEHKDGIEDFILKIKNTEDTIYADYLEKLRSMDWNEKIGEAVSLIEKIQDNQEFVVLVDAGCIVRVNNSISDWFQEIIKRDTVKQYTICVISRYRPTYRVISRISEMIFLSLSTLTQSDTKKLFKLCCMMRGLELSSGNEKRVLELLNGMPSQVYRVVDLIKDSNSVKEVLKDKEYILKIGEAHIYDIIESIKEQGNLNFDILVLMSGFSSMSYEMIYKITGEKEEVIDSILEQFNIEGILDKTGSAREIISVHFPVRDYIRRRKIAKNKTFESNIGKMVTEFGNSNNEIDDFHDLSKLSIVVQGALLKGYSIHKKFQIPSIMLNYISSIYYEKQYKDVVDITTQILEDKDKMDGTLVRQFTYWLCLSLSHLKDSRFESVVNNIKGRDYHFLYGFYHRKKRELDEAERYFRDAIKSSSFPRAQRELVDILLAKGQHTEALNLSRSNYEEDISNPLYMQSYFDCLVKKHPLTNEDKNIIKLLLKNIRKSHDTRAMQIQIVMEAKYAYHIDKNTGAALYQLKNYIKNSRSVGQRYYAVKAQHAILTQEKRHKDAKELITKHQDEIDFD